MFNKQELQALNAFLSRVDLKGNEAETHVYLTQKINNLIKGLEDAEKPSEADTEEETPEEDTDTE